MDEGPCLHQLRALLGTKPKPFSHNICPRSNISTKYCQCSDKCTNRVTERIGKFCRKYRSALLNHSLPLNIVNEFIEGLRKELKQEVASYHNLPQAPQPLAP